MELRLAKGVRDFPPKDMIIRQDMMGRIRKVFERYGYGPLETPVIERYDILTAKFAAGDTSDVMREIFCLKDQGERDLGLRFDLTVPFSRFVGMNPQLKMPFKRYAFGTVYRDGPIKLGRYREFLQCDADIVGCKTMMAEAEIIKMTLDVFSELGLDAYIEVNNRKLLLSIMKSARTDEDKYIPVITALDKFKKIGKDLVIEEIKGLGVNEESIRQILWLFEESDIDDYKKNISMLKQKLTDDLGKEGLLEIEEFFSYLEESEIKKVKFNIFLARGLGYYTGTVFEGFLVDSDVTSSICGGGRYDDMIGDYLETEKDFPAVGISFGIEPINEAIKLNNAQMNKQVKSSVADIYVIPIKTTTESLKIIKELRGLGLKADMDLIGRGISKNLQYANYYNIPYVLMVGPDELKNKKLKLKDMDSGEEKEIPLDDLKSLTKILS